METQRQPSLMQRLMHPLSSYTLKRLADKDDFMGIEQYSSGEQFVNDVGIITCKSDHHYHRPTYRVSLRKNNLLSHLAEAISREDLKQLLENVLAESKIPGELKTIDGEKSRYYLRVISSVESDSRTHIFIEKDWHSVPHAPCGGL